MSAAVVAALTALGLAAVALFITARRSQALRRRPGNVRAFARQLDRERWLGGHGVWVNDVFAFRRGPAGWEETLLWMASASSRAATEEELTRLPRIGEDPVVVTFALASGGSTAFAVRGTDRDALLGPFA